MVHIRGNRKRQRFVAAFLFFDALIKRGEGTIHEITQNDTNDYFVMVRVDSWIVLLDRTLSLNST